MKSVCWGINCRRFWPAVVAVFVFVFVTDFLIHGTWLSPLYASTPSLWRMKEEMSGFMGFMLLGQLLASGVMVTLFAKGYEAKGLMEGVRFGLLLGLWNTGYTFVQYSVSPLPPALVQSWIVAGFAQGVGGGIVMALIYRKV